MNAKKYSLWGESLEVGFSAWIEKHGYSIKTMKTYNSMIFAYFSFLDKKKINIDSANKTIVEQFFKERGVTEKTKVRYLWLINDIYDDMLDGGFISKNDISLVLEKKRIGMRGKSAKRLPTVLSSHETQLLLNYTSSLPRHYSGQRERCALLLLLGTGMREQELCDLKTNNMHLNDETAYITIIGKFDKERLVPIPEDIINELLEFIDLKESSNARRSDFFLSSQSTGNPYVPSSVYRIVNTAMIDAGILKDKMSPHVLRHTFITRQLSAGAALSIVKNWAGHDSIATTALYEHVVTSLHGAKTTL